MAKQNTQSAVSSLKAERTRVGIRSPFRRDPLESSVVSPFRELRVLQMPGVPSHASSALRDAAPSAAFVAGGAPHFVVAAFHSRFAAWRADLPVSVAAAASGVPRFASLPASPAVGALSLPELNYRDERLALHGVGARRHERAPNQAAFRRGLKPHVLLEAL